ncbi:hypothetical protein M3P21_21010 [Ruegeria sp. 2012CJ41-6]|uniref:Uncharacterized protein n=1 Tax=Ruegeria spongiae TaxID=2942209 RepID=A0ABT0Q7Z4_9RHOB|nr:hypothetical protein [Ruegeria spongiae]MCL6285999.1 hypothetical protein [Ruegeria spongiae]
MPTITFVDRPCGTGKTTALIDELTQWDASRDRPVIVVTPRLSEVKRIINGAPSANIAQPDDGEAGATKLEDIETLLDAGRNIACTHALYVKLRRLAQRGKLSGYRMVIDECPTPIELAPTISKADFKNVIEAKGLATVDETSGLVTPTDFWTERAAMGGKKSFAKQYALAATGRLFVTEERDLLMMAIPVEMLMAPASLVILTYLSEGSLIAAYLDRLEVPYGVRKWAGEADWIRKQRALISVETFDLPHVPVKRNQKRVDHAPMRLSFSGQTKKATEATVKKLGTRLKKMQFEGPLKGVRKEDVMVTSAADLWFADGTAQGGRKRCGPLSYNTGLKGSWSYDEAEARWHVTNGWTWVSNLTRGVNDHVNCSHAVYLFDQHPNPILCKFLDKKPHVWGRRFALTEFVQWLYRSRVRLGQPVTVYVPSERMRTIILDWLNSPDNGEFSDDFEPIE